MTVVTGSVGEALRWAGFRPLTPAEAARGPFAQAAGEQRHVRLDAAALYMAFVVSLDGEKDLASWIDDQRSGAWGYDLNLDGQAHRITTINELRFIITATPAAPTAALDGLGYRQQESCWMHDDPACLVPSPGPDHDGEIFPCLGWVPIRGATSEFGPGELRSGFCSMQVPQGAQAIRDTRGYQFIHDGYRQRIIRRRRVVTSLAPASAPALVRASVHEALALTYGDT